MIFQFAYKSWRPPQLSPEQVSVIVSNVRAQGVDVFVDRFVHLPTSRAFASGRTWQEIWDYWAPGVLYLAMGLIGLTLGLYADAKRVRAVEPVAAALLVAGLVGLPVFLTSVVLAASRYRRWLTQLVAVSNG